MGEKRRWQDLIALPAEGVCRWSAFPALTKLVETPEIVFGFGNAFDSPGLNRRYPGFGIGRSENGCRSFR